MKILTLSLLTLVLVGCKETYHPIITNSRVIPLEQAETSQINTLKTNNDNAYETYQQTNRQLEQYQSNLFNKYAHKDEELELSDDGKYVIAHPSNYYYFRGSN